VVGEATLPPDTTGDTGSIYRSGLVTVSGAAAGTCQRGGLASASLTRLWCIHAETSMEPFSNSWGLKEVSHDESCGRGTGRLAVQPSLAQHGHVMLILEGGDAVVTFLLARVGEIGGTGADSVQKQFLSGHLLSSLVKIRQQPPLAVTPRVTG